MTEFNVGDQVRISDDVIRYGHRTGTVTKLESSSHDSHMDWAWALFADGHKQDVWFRFLTKNNRTLNDLVKI